MVPKMIVVTPVGRNADGQFVFKYDKGHGVVSDSGLAFAAGEPPAVESSTLTETELRSIGDMAGKFGVSMAAQGADPKAGKAGASPAEVEDIFSKQAITTAEQDFKAKKSGATPGASSSSAEPPSDGLTAVNLGETASKAIEAHNRNREQSQPMKSRSFDPFKPPVGPRQERSSVL